MKTEKSYLSELEPVLPCSRLVNGFRLKPFFSKSFKIVWIIKPNFSNYTFAFSSLKFAELFASSYVNNHSDRFWYKLYRSEFSPIIVAASLDDMDYLTAYHDLSYCDFVTDAVISALHCN